MANAREQELLGYFRQHFADELAGNVEKTLAGCTADIVYEHPFRLGVMRGLDEVRAYYQETWSVRPFEQIDIVRHWLAGDDTIFCEIDTIFGPPDGTRVRTLCAGVFREGKLAREIVYSGPPIG